MDHLKKLLIVCFFYLSIIISSCQNGTQPQKKVEDEFLRLDDNGVTIKASDNALVGNIYKLNGIDYEVVDVAYLRRAIANGEDVTFFVTSKVRNMRRLFYEDENFNQDISTWDVSNVTDMEDMFFRSYSFNQDISNWDVSNVTDMTGMFYNASLFNYDISVWDVSKVTSMSRMFYGTSFNQDISSWDVSNVTNMSSMFCNAYFNQDISSWDVGNVKYMSHMFRSASYFNQDLKIWNVNNVEQCYDFSLFANAWIERKKPILTNCEE